MDYLAMDIKDRDVYVYILDEYCMHISVNVVLFVMLSFIQNVTYIYVFYFKIITFLSRESHKKKKSSYL